MEFYLIIWFAIYLLSFVFGIRHKDQCKMRLPLTYFILSLVVIGSLLIMKILEKNKFIPKNNLILFIVTILILILINYAPRNSILKVIFFTIFIIVISISFYPIYLLGKQKNLNFSTFLSVIGIFLSMSLFAIIFPQFISFNLGPILFFSLLALILFRLGLYFTNTSVKSRIYLYSSYFAVILFSIFILYDTKYMIIRANNCKVPFDYITNIISLFLDLINLFVELLAIKSR